MNLPAGIAKFFRPKPVAPAAADTAGVDVAPLPGQRRPAPAPADTPGTTPRRPAAVPSPARTAPRGPAADALSRHTAEIVAAAADTLCISCLYFTRENLAALGGGVRVAERLERLDPLFRAALMDGQTNAGEGARFLVLVECRNELYAGV